MIGTNAHLLSPLTIRGRTLRNRIAISPMCTYSASGGMAEDFHLVHYGRFGLGGAGLVMVEATSVVPNGRISYGDLGLWSDDQIESLSRIARILKQQGAAAGIQLCHAGRKANWQRPWQGNGPLSEEDHMRGEKDWPLTAPSPIAMAEAYQVPHAITPFEMEQVRQAFVAATERAAEAGFDIVEIHAAHGFLLHSFMSPLTNHRDDRYSGDFEGRHRFALEVVGDVRSAWPDDRPLFVRASMFDGADGGRDFAETVEFARALKRHGVDVVDCSSGGIGGHSASTSVRQAPSGFGFQIPLAERLRAQARIATMAVGLITDASLADEAIREGRADLIAIGRQALVEPNWPLYAEAKLRGLDEDKPFSSWPVQYGWWLNGRRPVMDRLGADPLGRQIPDRTL
jgi:2,4-dienoyl-CoA reductase-like NADH-dependent reductase (Old Yellow Enzyme family)